MSSPMSLEVNCAEPLSLEGMQEQPNLQSLADATGSEDMLSVKDSIGTFRWGVSRIDADRRTLSDNVGDASTSGVNINFPEYESAFHVPSSIHEVDVMYPASLRHGPTVVWADADDATAEDQVSILDARSHGDQPSVDAYDMYPGNTIPHPVPQSYFIGSSSDHKQSSVNITRPKCRRSNGWASNENFMPHICRDHDEHRELFECDECEYTTVKATDLSRHVNSCHQKLLRFACPMCRREFPRKDNCRRHIRGVHNEVLEPIHLNAVEEIRIKAELDDSTRHIVPHASHTPNEPVHTSSDDPRPMPMDANLPQLQNLSDVLRGAEGDASSVASWSTPAVGTKLKSRKRSKGMSLKCQYNRAMPGIFGPSNNRYIHCETTEYVGIAGVCHHLRREHHVHICGVCLLRFETDFALDQHRNNADKSCMSLGRGKEFERWRKIYVELIDDGLEDLHNPGPGADPGFDIAMRTYEGYVLSSTFKPKVKFQKAYPHALTPIRQTNSMYLSPPPAAAALFGSTTPSFAGMQCTRSVLSDRSTTPINQYEQCATPVTSYGQSSPSTTMLPPSTQPYPSIESQLDSHRMKERLATLQSANEAHEVQLKDLAGKITKLREQVVEGETYIETLRGRESSQAAEIVALQKEIDDLRRQGRSGLNRKRPAADPDAETTDFTQLPISNRQRTQ